LGEDARNVEATEGSARLGDLLALVGAIAIAFYVMIGRKLRAKVSLLAYVVPLYSICALALFAAAYAHGDRITGYDVTDYGYFMALALVPTIFGHTVFNWALKHVKAGVVSVSFLGEPIGATLLAMIFFHQIPALTTVVCGIVILAGIYLTTISGSIEEA
jgi:drug/metabolite transporter (DMT)-like permease